MQKSFMPYEKSHSGFPNCHNLHFYYRYLCQFPRKWSFCYLAHIGCKQCFIHKCRIKVKSLIIIKQTALRNALSEE